MTGVDILSAASAKLTMFFNDTPLSTGTCFFWRHERHIYLITNWHNFSGRDNLTGEHLSQTLAEPNNIECSVVLPAAVGVDFGKFRAKIVDEENNPLWIEHPIFGRNVDVVALPLPDSMNKVVCVNDKARDTVRLGVGVDVFILGYPLGIGVENFPLWKRGTIASEPEMDIDGKPLLYVDTATTKGMSGSPVIVRTNSGSMDDGSVVMASTRVMTRFVGIYSGRIAPRSGLDAQIGRVWKGKVIDEVLLNRR
ncbi:serine protease [Ensifer aridi]|uniref:S1 family peptidase n=1 Tax=Ensifer aridi TaxID=1708715 RepID=UPI00358F0E69